MTAAVLAGSAAGSQAGAVTVVRTDLDFILQQIKIAENHANGGQLQGPGANQVNSPLLPDGLRTVDGSMNNLAAPGNARWGAADELFPRLLPPQFKLPGYTTAAPNSVVTDPEPRRISNLVVDQSTDNPAANAAAGANAPEGDNNVIPNVDPGLLGPPFSSWMTLFGQFFDHGLDLVPKGGNGTVMIPLPADDPLIPGPDGILGNADDLPVNARFMMLTRATRAPGSNTESINKTTPFVDQQQTYGSHGSIHFFLREYQPTPNGPVATGRLLESPGGGLATWGQIKNQALTVLGIQLSDEDALNAPMVATDPYGRFLPGPNGFPRIVLNDSTFASGTPGAPVVTTNAMRSNHAFLDDIAHGATPSAGLAPDPNTTPGGAPPAAGFYDNEMLDEHFVAGDGRANENIGLTAIHHVFHAEHNRMVDVIRTRVAQFAIAGNDLAFLNEWLDTPVNAMPADVAAALALDWDGERVFQAARFITEMEYQHLVFEEFARKVEPTIAAFAAYDATIDPAIKAEFAHVVYRFGHSMLREQVDVTDANGSNARSSGLIEAFLNPLAYDDNNTLTPDQAAGAIARGMSRQTGNEIDEFVTGALRNNLLGLPLDLATLNLTRARETGVPSLNAARRTFFQQTGDAALAPHTSWNTFRVALRHPESLINFIAAYGTHPTVTAAQTSEGKRIAAFALVFPDQNDPQAVADSDAFLNSTGAYAPQGGIPTTGVEDIDFWIGGLAEAPAPVGGMLSPTFAHVFRSTLEDLQNGDRFYYLLRLEGLNLLPEIEANAFSEMVVRNTTMRTIPFDAFARADRVFDLANLNNTGLSDNQNLIPVQPDGFRQFFGGEHIVMAGSTGADRMRGGAGDDTLWGHEGNDDLDGGAGNDALIGGDGADVIVDSGGALDIDTIKGGSGDDAINGGQGADVMLGEDGNDVVVGTEGPKEVFLGNGNDFFLGGTGDDAALGNDGDDWMEGRAGVDALTGGHAAPFENDKTTGDDVLIGGPGDDAYAAEGGDDIMVNDDGLEEHLGMFGFDWATHRGTANVVTDLNNSPLDPVDPNNPAANLVDTFRLTEGLSGAAGDDVLRGDRRGNGDAANDAFQGTFEGHELTRPGLIEGLQALLGPGVSQFSGGNILLGGAGSDLIEGRGGNDIIDGDRFLEVYLQAPPVGGGPLERIDSVEQIRARIFDRSLVPSQVSIRRVITNPATGAGVDTAQFSGPRADYDIFAETGRIRIVHQRGERTDGEDILYNIEQLAFSDQTLAVADIPTNARATGAPTISDPSPARGQLITASPGDLADIDGFNPAGVSYEWQAERPGTQGWTLVRTGPNFRPGESEVGQRLRVIANFTDGKGGAESVESAPTAPVAAIEIPAPPTPPAPPAPVAPTAPTTNEVAPPAGAPARPVTRRAAVTGVKVPARIKAQRVRVAGVPVTMRALAPTRLVRIQIVKVGTNRPIVTVTTRVQAGKRNVVQLRQAKVKRFLVRGGAFRVTVTPASGPAQFGAPVNRRMVVTR